MIAKMAPVLRDGRFVFCATDDARAALCREQAIGSFREDEGWSFILPAEDAARIGCDVSLPLRQITLRVFSALDGVGLTAAVAGAPAQAGIACNMVAAFRHDHVFVPAAAAVRTMDILEALQRRAATVASGADGG